MMTPLRHEPNSVEGREQPEAAQEISAEHRSAEAGQQLAAARTADRKWRDELVLRTHHRLGKLRQSEQLIRRCGKGICGALGLAAMAMAWWDASMEWPMSLMVGAFAASFATAGLTATIAWVHDHTRSLIAQMELTEELPPATEEAYRIDHPHRSGHDMVAELLGPIVMLLLAMLLLIVIRVIAMSVGGGY